MNNVIIYMDCKTKSTRFDCVLFMCPDITARDIYCMDIMKVPHFRVGNTRIRNKMQAWAEHKRTGLPVSFDLYESAFDAVDWSQEPALTWNQLLDLRAHQIAALNRPIVIGYSGGTDSYTIYEVFKRNNIKIAAVFVRSRVGWEFDVSFRAPLAYMESESKTYGFKLHEEKEHNSWYEAFYDSPDWIWSDHNLKIQFSNGFQLNPDLDRIAPGLVSSDYVYVNGLDKPRLRIKHGRFCTYQSHVTWSSVSGNERCEPFYMHWRMPELHVKQSYMLARYVMQHALAHDRPLESYVNVHRPDCHDYHGYAFDGCGRFGEWTQSATQKMINIKSKMLLPKNKDLSEARFSGRSQDWFQSGLARGESFAVNHVKGLLALRADPLFSELHDDSNLYATHMQAESKHYELNIDLVDFDQKRQISKSTVTTF